MDQKRSRKGKGRGRGAAYYELSGGLEPSGLADHVASPLRNLNATPEEWSQALALARTRWEAGSPASRERPAARGFAPPPAAREATELAQLLAALSGAR